MWHTTDVTHGGSSLVAAFPHDTQAWYVGHHIVGIAGHPHIAILSKFAF